MCWDSPDPLGVHATWAQQCGHCCVGFAATHPLCFPLLLRIPWPSAGPVGPEPSAAPGKVLGHFERPLGASCSSSSSASCNARGRRTSASRRLRLRGDLSLGGKAGPGSSELGDRLGRRRESPFVLISSAAGLAGAAAAATFGVGSRGAALATAAAFENARGS